MQNPDDGRFCRACGAGLEAVAAGLGGRAGTGLVATDRRGRPVSWEGALTKLFMGIAFVAVAIALSASQAGRGWWYWMLIPAFSMMASGVGRIMHLRSAERRAELAGASQSTSHAAIPGASAAGATSLPPSRTEYVDPAPPRGSIYDTGDLAAQPPSSVVEPTTRHLEADSEGETMTLPKK